MNAGARRAGLRNVRIGVRLGAGFGAVLLLMTLAMAGADFAQRRSVEQQVGALRKADEKLTAAASMRASLLEAAIAMRNLAMQADVAGTQREEAKVKNARAAYARAHQAFTALGVSASETASLDAIDKLDARMSEPLEEVLAQGLMFNQEGAMKIVNERIDPLTQSLMAEINKLLAQQKTLADANVAAGAKEAERTRAMLYSLGAAALLLGTLCAWIFTRSIVRPLHEAVEVARRVSSGRLDTHIDACGRDEVGELLRALREMNESLARIVGQVHEGTAAVETASHEIARANADLSGRTESQASFLEETAGSLEELTAAVAQNSESARKANALAEATSDVAVRGGEAVARVVEKMGAIRKSSGLIQGIIGTIDAIAFQTNILALNAAVEAARAGAEGRGFAVVASEVRNLAQRCAEAAQETKRLIEASSLDIEVGSKLISEAGDTMNGIVDSVRELAGLVAEISRASAEQRRGIEQVNAAIGQMDSMTQQNAAMVEQAAAVSESLRENANRLALSVGAFSLGESHRASEARLDDGIRAAAPALEGNRSGATRPMPARLPQPVEV